MYRSCDLKCNDTNSTQIYYSFSDILLTNRHSYAGEKHYLLGGNSRALISVVVQDLGKDNEPQPSPLRLLASECFIFHHFT